MKKDRRFIWTAMGIACSLLLGTAGIAAGGIDAADSQVLHLGPMRIEQGQRVLLTVTNLTDAPARPSLTILGETGQALKGRRAALEPGQAFILPYIEQDALFRIVRGRVVIPGGSPESWAVGFRLLEGDPPTVLANDETHWVGHDRASSAIGPLLGDPYTDDLYIVNLSPQPADYTISFVDPSGSCLAQMTLEDVPAAHAGGINVGMGDGSVRAVVEGPPGSPFLASLDSRLQDGTLIEHADIQYNSLIIVVC